MADFNQSDFRTSAQYLRAYSSVQEDDDGYHFGLLQRARRAAQLSNSVQLRASKLVQYTVLEPPATSVSVAKFVQYTVLEPPATSISVAKFVQYIVISTPPSPPPPARSTRWMIDGQYAPDVGYEDVPNLNLLRAVRTPASAYYVRPPPVAAKPANFVRDFVPQEEDPFNLNIRVRRVTSPTAYVLPGIVPAIAARSLGLNAKFAIADEEADAHFNLIRRLVRGVVLALPPPPTTNRYVGVVMMG